MNLQDLTNNRDRIIKKIKMTSSNADVKSVMSKMVAWLTREDIQGMKPTMGNLDKFTAKVTESWIKNDWKPTYTKNENDAMNLAKKLDNLPSSLR